MQVSCAVFDKPPICAGVRRFETEDPKIGATVQFLKKRADGLLRNEWAIAIKDDQITLKALQRVFSRHDRVPCPQRWVLNNESVLAKHIRHVGLQPVRARAHHSYYALAAGFPGKID